MRKAGELVIRQRLYVSKLKIILYYIQILFAGLPH